jgi:hypothetical protein
LGSKNFRAAQTGSRWQARKFSWSCGRQERRLVMIEPPRDAGDAEYLKSTIAFSSPRELALVEQRSGAMHQPVILVARVPGDALAMKAREQRG